MIALIDKESEKIISYMADATLKMGGIEAYKTIKPFLDNLQKIDPNQ